MCGGPHIFCCFQLRWSALCYFRGYCYKLGLSLFFFFFFLFFVFFCIGAALVLLRGKWL